MVQITEVYGSQGPYHHGSHEGLLLPAAEPVSPGPGVDAIIVPTARQPSGLEDAAALALDLECPLVTLHSGQRTSASLAAKRLPAGLDLLALDIPAASRGSLMGVPRAACLRLPDWKTSAKLSGTPFHRQSDLSLKRNLALALSHMVGWSTVLFLDDDITNLNPVDIRTATGLLSNYSAVGIELDVRPESSAFPDNSVVCLAYREAGGKQKSFIGGGALVVELQAAISRNSFFPDIYNDDWFFLLDGDKGLLPATTTGQVRQRPHDPFKSPERARDQELGEVLAEGVYWLLDQGRSIHDANRRHWIEFLEIRRKFIHDVIQMVGRGELHVDEKQRRNDALRYGSLERLALITPELCEAYLDAWRSDRNAWREYLDELPTGISPADALVELTAPECPPLRWYRGRREA